MISNNVKRISGITFDEHTNEGIYTIHFSDGEHWGILDDMVYSDVVDLVESISLLIEERDYEKGLLTQKYLQLKKELIPYSMQCSVV